MGVPQKSILSLLLFSLMLSGLLMCKDDHNLLFADALSLFVVKDNLEDAKKKFQMVINKTRKWLNECRETIIH